MPHYDTETKELVYTSAESEPFGCPVCTAGPEFGDCEILDSNFVRSRWKCPECGASGSAYDKLTFDGHRVDISSLSPKMQREYAAVKTMCINGPVRVGDLVLSTIDDNDFPCLPGRVTGIGLLDSEDHTTSNETDDVHVDFTGNYGEKRRREIVEAYAGLAGNPPAFEDIRLDDIVMAPGCLINVTGSITDEDWETVVNDGESAVRYAYRVVRGRLGELEKSA